MKNRTTIYLLLFFVVSLFPVKRSWYERLVGLAAVSNDSLADQAGQSGDNEDQLAPLEGLMGGLPFCGEVPETIGGSSTLEYLVDHRHDYPWPRLQIVLALFPYEQFDVFACKRAVWQLLQGNDERFIQTFLEKAPPVDELIGESALCWFLAFMPAETDGYKQRRSLQLLIQAGRASLLAQDKPDFFPGPLPDFYVPPKLPYSVSVDRKLDSKAQLYLRVATVKALQALPDNMRSRCIKCSRSITREAATKALLCPCCSHYKCSLCHTFCPLDCRDQ